ncbi:MAG TPA: toll/interleukin-1 receptor domain-containing protein [Ktedonobacteraceae bacterium]|nr:toll/interleukin-1 receptor domain-containing protein [Ktedonobacteraceae bacterium]
MAHIRHHGLSPIHLSSLQLPQDGSALHFLRGVGLTDEQIDAWRVIAGLPIQYHSVFISYCSKDEILAHRLHADLQAHGVRCWFAPEDMKIGNRIRDTIDRAIHVQDRSLLLLLEHSIVSTWVEQEVPFVREARRKEQTMSVITLPTSNAIFYEISVNARIACYRGYVQ